MERKRRLFFAIELPNNLRKELIGWERGTNAKLHRVAKDRAIPIRWTKEESLHVTLVFIGYVPEDAVSKVIEAGKRTAHSHGSFAIQFHRIMYAPPGRSPRMLWLDGPVIESYAKIKSSLEKELVSVLPKDMFMPEVRESKLHVTLARFDEEEWRAMFGTRKPKVETTFDATFDAKKFVLMESKLSRGGAEYHVIQSFPFAHL